MQRWALPVRQRRRAVLREQLPRRWPLLHLRAHLRERSRRHRGAVSALRPERRPLLRRPNLQRAGDAVCVGHPRQLRPVPLPPL